MSITLTNRRGRAPLMRTAVTWTLLAGTLVSETLAQVCGVPGDARCETWTGRQDHFPIDIVRGIAASPTGDRVFLTGASTLPNRNNNFVTIAYDADGNFLWKKVYDGPARIDDTPWAIAVSPDGATVVAAGMQNHNREGLNSTTDWAVVAYEAATGNQKWVATFDGGGFDLPSAMAFSPDGARVYVTGSSIPPEGPASDYDQVTAAFATNDGSRLWLTRNASPGDGKDQAFAIAVSRDGTTVATTGTYQNAAEIRGFGTAVYDASTGERRWLQSANLGERSYITSFDVLISPDSSLVHVLGPLGTETLLITYRLDAGEEVWRDRRAGSCDYCNPALAVSPTTGEVYVTGSGADPATGGDPDFVVVAHRGASGEVAWTFRYDFLGQAEIQPQAVVSGDGGRVYLSGVSVLNGSTRSLTTLALDTSNGELQWDARYGPPETIDNFPPSVPFMDVAGRRLRVGIEIAQTLFSSDFFLAAYDDDPAPPLPGCGFEWRITPSPNVGVMDNILRKVAPVSADDVWAVGYTITGINLFQTMIQRWDGAQWKLIPSPNVGTSYNALFGVAAQSANDVWAAGYYDAGSEGVKTLIEHWDGTQWSVVPSPNARRDNLLYAISTSSSSDAWAVGKARTRSDVPLEGVYESLTLHWNGAAWSVVPSPQAGVGGEDVLFGVKAISANDAWAVGSFDNGAGVYQSLTLHWDGMNWSIVNSPNAGNSNILTAVEGTASNDVWAVGYSAVGANVARTLILHWNGAAWSLVPSPNVSNFNTFASVVALAPNDVWAVGSYYTDAVVLRTMVQHWNGTEWSVVPSPNAGMDDNGLAGVGAIPATAQRPRELWAVGAARGGSDRANQTLVQRYHDPCQVPVQALNAISRKGHGPAGTFDIDLPFTGEPGVECRASGENNNHQVVLLFPQRVTYSGASAAPEPGGTAEVDSTSTNANEVIVNLKNVSDAQTLTITLHNVNNQADVTIPMRIVAGDTNADTRVNVGDTNQTKSNSGSLTNEGNFRTDVNLDGRINVGDANFVKAQAGFEAARTHRAREVRTRTQLFAEGSE